MRYYNPSRTGLQIRTGTLTERKKPIEILKEFNSMIAVNEYNFPLDKIDKWNVGRDNFTILVSLTKPVDGANKLKLIFTQKRDRRFGDFFHRCHEVFNAKPEQITPAVPPVAKEEVPFDMLRLPKYDPSSTVAQSAPAKHGGCARYHPPIHHFLMRLQLLEKYLHPKIDYQKAKATGINMKISLVYL